MADKIVDLKEFLSILEKSKEEVIREVEMFLMLFIQECMEEVIVGGEYGPGTPVDTGFLRAMWWLSINGAGQSPNHERPKPGEGVLAVQLPVLTDVHVGDLVELCNNTEYAEYVEKGTSVMAPRAMVGTVVTAAGAIARKVAGRLGWSTDSLVYT